MEGQRPDPDVLLKRVEEEEARQRRGKLKIFFGASAGVGKTYAMLEAAHEQKRDGVDVVAGIVVTHGRLETEALLKGLEILAPRTIDYQGTSLQEFDLDRALARRPTVILIDELAHTNAPGSRHPKRCQDVEELLAAGINVYTTVNVQHLESLNDVVTQITGIRVRETIPDSILERADDVELIDLPPDDLLQRLKEGKVYVPDQVRHAIRHFFRKGNLIALRELALRRTADRVDQQMEVYRRDHAVVRTWPAGETIMVCVNMKPRGQRLVRAARRMAVGLHAKWIAVYVQTSRHLRVPETERARVVETLRFAEQLGAETVTLSGEQVGEQLLNYARERNVTKLIVGKPIRSRWKAWVFGSVVEELVRNAGDIDIYVMTGEAGDEPPQVVDKVQRPPRRWWPYVEGLGVVAACTAVNWLMFPYFGVANLIMVYLLGVAIVAARFGRGPSVLASVAGVALFDFFFIPPYLSFAVSDTQYVITFVVMLTIALLISRLTAGLQQQAEASRLRERRTAVLYAMSRDLATQRKVADLVAVALRHLREIFDSHTAVFLPNESGRLVLQRTAELFFELDPKEAGVAEWVYRHGRQAGLGTDTLPGAGALYWPLRGSQGTVGVLAVRPSREARLLEPEQLHLLETLANHTASAIERASLAMESHRAQVQAETERMRNAILSTISHDLRTPLATITGAASSLLHSPAGTDPSHRELIESIYNEADRLERLINNLMNMTRLETGAVRIRKEWHAFDEIIGAAVTRFANRLGTVTIHTRVSPDLPLVPIDAVLIQQVLVNLLENALKYAPPQSTIDLSATALEKDLLLEIADRGPGVPPGEEERIFEKFYRADAGREGGVGLGLTICRGIIEAHGGRIWAENRPGGGAVFRLTLPLNGLEIGGRSENDRPHSAASSND